jgi:membrane protein
VSGGAAQPVHVGVAQRLVAPPLRFVRDWLARFLELQGFDRAVALAGQAFTALVPLLIVYGAITSNVSGRVFADQLISVPSASAAPRPRTCARRSRLRPTSRAASAARGDLLVFSALSFTRALQRLYQLAWEQPSLGMRAAKWGLIWLVIAVVTMTMRPLVLGGLHGVVRVVLSIALAGVVWLITPYVLLARRVSWRRLAPAALLTGVGMTGPGALLGDVDAALGRDVGGPVRVDRARRRAAWLAGRIRARARGGCCGRRGDRGAPPPPPPQNGRSWRDVPGRPSAPREPASPAGVMPRHPGVGEGWSRPWDPPRRSIAHRTPPAWPSCRAGRS